VDPILKQKALARIYSWHEEWSRALPLACRKGCSSCCTRSVTISGLEETYLREHLAQAGKTGLLAGLPALAPDGARPASTTNQFAAACLQGIESAGEPDGWNLAPCPFLLDRCCTVYPARPFGCRAFGSLTRCDSTGAAELPHLLLTVNTVIFQLIEHLDQGGAWGNLLDLLAAAAEADGDQRQEPRPPLLTCIPCPGFLIPPEEQAEVEHLLAGLLREPVGSISLGELLGRGPEGP
jgi:Fe-S-cluster containining protein